MNLVELQNKIHQQNVDMGWWDEPRQFSTFVCLFHSELSEAMEGDRKGLMDDHLPKYPMFQVELADFVIRCLDWLGFQSSIGNVATTGEPLCCNLKWGNVDLLAHLHAKISNAYALETVNKPCLSMEKIEQSALLAFYYAESKGFDLHQIILEKVEYNKHRADHKRENRAKTGGKKY